MTRTLTEIVLNLLLPPAGPLLVALAGLLLSRRYRRLGMTLSALGVAALWVLSLTVVGNSLLRLVEPPPAARGDLAAVEAIVVLGGGVVQDPPEYREPVANSYTLARVRYGAFLARETGIPILVSGGAPSGGVPEAEVMASMLKSDFGIAPRWIENASATTAENAARSFAMLARERKTRIALVTNTWHMPRARRAFEAAGFIVVPAGTGYSSREPARLVDFLPSPTGLFQTRTVLWELLGSLWYAMKQ